MELIYKGLRGTLEQITVTEEEVDRQMARLQQQTPKITQVTDRAAAAGDEVVLDYAGYCDGVQFEGGTAQGQTLVLGSGTFIPGFEEQLIGAQLEEPVVVKVTFPAQYPAENLAGKNAEFHCRLHEIRQKSTYALDDEFARAVGVCDSYADMREVLRQSLQQHYDQQAEIELENSLARQAAETLDFEPTEAQIENAVNFQMQTLENQLQQRNLSLEAYCQFTGQTEAQIRQDARPEAVQTLRIQTMLERVAILEGLGAEAAELEQALSELCSQNQVSMQQLAELRNAEFDQALRQSIVAKKAMQCIRDAAIVAVVPAKTAK